MNNRNTFTVLAVAFLLILAGCQSESEDPQIDCSVSTLSVSVSTVTNTTCDQLNGEITVSASGGSGNYEFSLSGGGQNSTGTFENLAAGGYTITVDDGDCTASVTTSVNNEGGVIIDEVALQASGCDESNGMVTVTASEGIGPYQYAIGEGDFQDENEFSGLSQGTYLLRVNDSQNCEITQEVHVLSGVSWENDIKAIIDANCAVPSCHGGTQSPDFRELSNVQSNATNIKTRTGNGTMPPVGSLPAEMIQAIACWVDDGAPNN